MTAPLAPPPDLPRAIPLSGSWIAAGIAAVAVLVALAYGAGRSNGPTVTASTPAIETYRPPSPATHEAENASSVTDAAVVAPADSVPENSSPAEEVATKAMFEEGEPDVASPAHDEPEAANTPLAPPAAREAEAEIDAAESALGSGWTRVKDMVDTDGRIVRWSRDGGHAFVVVEVHREPGWSFASLKRQEEARLDGDPNRTYTLVRNRSGGEARPATAIWNYKLRNGGEPLMHKMLAGFPGAGDEPPLLFHCSREDDAPRAATLADFNAAFFAVGRARATR